MPTDIVFLIARILMGAPFVVAGIRNFRNLDRLVGLMEGRKVPNARIAHHCGCLGAARFGPADRHRRAHAVGGARA